MRYIILCVVMLLFPATVMSDIDGVLYIIGQGESNGDYDAEWGNGKYGYDRKLLVNMTMLEVREYQRYMINTQIRLGFSYGKRSSAIGKYQFISKSFISAQKLSKLDDNDYYSQVNQDLMGMNWLLYRCGVQEYLDSSKTLSDKARFVKRIARQWASIKDITGIGLYDNDGNNKARYSILPQIETLS